MLTQVPHQYGLLKGAHGGTAAAGCHAGCWGVGCWASACWGVGCWAGCWS